MAVNTSSSLGSFGGSRRIVLSLDWYSSQGGSYAETSVRSFADEHGERTVTKRSTCCGIHSPVGSPRGDNVDSHS